MLQKNNHWRNQKKTGRGGPAPAPTLRSGAPHGDSSGGGAAAAAAPLSLSLYPPSVLRRGDTFSSSFAATSVTEYEG